MAGSSVWSSQRYLVLDWKSNNDRGWGIHYTVYSVQTQSMMALMGIGWTYLVLMLVSTKFVVRLSSRKRARRILAIRCASHASKRRRPGRTCGPTDGRTDPWTDGQTYGRTVGRTHPLIEMLGASRNKRRKMPEVEWVESYDFGTKASQKQCGLKLA